MSNPYANPYSPNAIPERAPKEPKEASRVSAHSENKMNDLSPVNNTSKMPSIGKQGLKGDGQQK